MDKPVNPDENAEFNTNGTNEFEFVNTDITSVVYKDGEKSTLDPVVGRHIIGNLHGPLPKLTDITRNVPSHTSIFGMHVGVKWSDDFPSKDEDIAFYGKCSRMIIAGFSWSRMKCYDADNYGTELYQYDFQWTGQSTATISEIDWNHLGTSLAVTQLKDAAAAVGGTLQMRITLFYHTQNYPPYVARNATLGYVLGVIGVSSKNDVDNIPGERGMFFKKDPLDLTYDKDVGDLCYKKNLKDFDHWVNFAPFEVDKKNLVDRKKHEVRLDLSNSIPTNLANTLRTIGTLRLGVLLEADSCVLLLGSESGLPYSSSIDLPITSAIYAVEVDASLLDSLASNPLVLVQMLPVGKGSDKLCSYRTESEAHSANIILQEYPYFFRPKNYYSILLDRNHNPTGSQTVYVTKYGKPVDGLKLSVVKSEVIGRPKDGVVAVDKVATTKNGLAEFKFKLDTHIPILRNYNKAPCNNSYTYEPDDRLTLPIDGQVYLFYYCPQGDSESECQKYSYVQTFVLGFSDVQYSKPYTWVKDVGPIFTQYAQMAPTMRRILDMSNYKDVTLLHNLNLLKFALNLDFDDPSHMPTTRDLSPTKRAMILEWLDNPLYDSTPNNKLEPQAIICKAPSSHAAKTPDYFLPIRCGETLSFDTEPHDLEPYFRNIFGDPSENIALYGSIPIPGRPLASEFSCFADNVKIQLQTAIQLEWATLPPYLTSLYSIVEGCNTEIYNTIRTVIMQEMLHFTQSANTLVAMGGSPLIDDKDMTPEYPTKGLPGGVLKGLEISLEKLSLKHVYSVFMGIETPIKTDIGGIHIHTDKRTIGAFYTEIRDCIGTLDDKYFQQASVDRQVKWPWTPNDDQGNLVTVTSAKSAQDGIDMIVSQGEGTGSLDPTQIGSNTLAHFFKFEEIVCQRHLKKTGNDTYKYSGKKIEYESAGVWPMRHNPAATTVPRNTNCYTESRAFHQVYRMLLKKLQDVFNGNPKDIGRAVQLMESLQLHAKKLRWVKFNPNNPYDDTTCGPVWDYEWPEDAGC